MSITEFHLKIKKQAFSEYLNSMDTTEEEYLNLYNHYAKKNHKAQLKSTSDIYTAKNNQDSFIRYIIMGNDSFYDSLHNSVLTFFHGI